MTCCSQEDIDHWLKYATMRRRGEWYVGGERLPGVNHRQSLPLFSKKLCEAPRRPSNFPEMMIARRDKFDGCPNPFSYDTNYHQTAEWRAKTAEGLTHLPLLLLWPNRASLKLLQMLLRWKPKLLHPLLLPHPHLQTPLSVIYGAYNAAAGAVSSSLMLSAASARAASVATAIASSTGGITRSSNKVIEYDCKQGHVRRQL